jgi:hypothetical protein
MELFDVVDLGTKQGNAMDVFLKTAGSHYLKQSTIDSFDRKKCVGFERPEGRKYQSEVARKGFQFKVANLATDEGVASLPESKVYLAWHFLEHLPNKAWSKRLVQAALAKSKVMAWFRLPSFEQDDMNGEGVLRKHGMRFTWTNWIGHPSHWLVSDCQQAIEEWCERPQSTTERYTLTIKPAGYIRDMRDPRVVPINAPVDTNKYHPSFGSKPLSVVFDRPIVAEWEVIVRFMT